MSIFKLSIFLLALSITATLNLASSDALNLSRIPKSDGCSALHDYPDNQSKCAYIKTNIGCRPKGYINSYKIFYCTFGNFQPLLGYSILFIWLILLFYILANTASEYFCSSLENLSSLLKLSPTLAGTTLLPLGNGATDVFSTVVSFTRSNDSDVGVNTILGGALFLSTVVVGVLCIVINPKRRIKFDKPSFVRDIIFFVFSLLAFLIIILVGKISFSGAVFFSLIYIVYICVVFAMQLFYIDTDKATNCDMGLTLLDSAHKQNLEFVEKNEQKWLFDFLNLDPTMARYLGIFLYILELPIYLPRRLTIPVVTEEKWSKLYGVISVTLAPILLATLYNTQREKMGSKISLEIYMSSVLVGGVFGNFAYEGTQNSSPPKKFLLPWVLGGFLMSITWTYIIAEELVSLLVSIGSILGISPSILGLTVLAWGNSIGDLISNVALAIHGGPSGAQIAISGCYAGPVFNILVGLGTSFVYATWSGYPDSFTIQDDPFLYEDIGFLIGGLVLALVIFPKRNMRPDRYLGIGLLSMYSCFLCMKLARAVGLIN